MDSEAIEANVVIESNDQYKSEPKAENHIWHNQDNINFYEGVTVEGLKQLAVKAGLTNACDVTALKSYWENADSVLDVGAAYGRVVKGLLSNGYKGKITAIERSHTFCHYLSEKFQDNITLLNIDSADYYTTQSHFDTILFLWSGLADYSVAEQPVIVKKLSQLLNRNGYLIIDTMPMNIKPLHTTQFASQSFSTQIKNETVYTYEAKTAEIRQYAQKCKLSFVELIHCKTDNGRMRWLYVLQRSLP